MNDLDRDQGEASEEDGGEGEEIPFFTDEATLREVFVKEVQEAKDTVEIEIYFSADDPEDLPVNITCEGPDVKILDHQGVIHDVPEEEEMETLGVYLKKASAHASTFSYREAGG